VTGQSNKTLSNGFVKEIIDRNCTLTVEDKSFNILQLINLAQSTTLANNSVQLDHLNKNSNLFYFENIMFEKYPDKSTITDWLIIKPEEKEGPNYWLYFTIKETLGNKPKILHTRQVGFKIKPGAAVYFFGVKYNYRVSCR
jgi:hypothetical protein